MTITHRYYADVTYRIRLMVESTDTESAQEVARRTALRRPGVQPEHLASVIVTPLTELEQKEIGNRHAWQEHQALRDRGTFDQRTRWSSCILPDEELLGIVRTELFRSFGLFTKRRQMTFADVPHPVDFRGIWECLRGTAAGVVGVASKSLADMVTWETAPNPRLTAPEYRALLRIQETVAEIRRHPWMQGTGGEPVSAEVREHRGTCKKCGGMTFERSALVTIQWAGRCLSREYVL
jgi:hypothetical protein